jgi:hypothetical protein
MLFMLRFLPIFCCIALLGACASKAVPPDYVGLSEADVVAKHGYPIDRRIVADDVVVLVFRSRLGSERFVTLVNDRVDRVQNDRNLSLFKLIPIVID